MRPDSRWPLARISLRITLGSEAREKPSLPPDKTITIEPDAARCGRQRLEHTAIALGVGFGPPSASSTSVMAYSTQSIGNIPEHAGKAPALRPPDSASGQLRVGQAGHSMPLATRPAKAFVLAHQCFLCGPVDQAALTAPDVPKLSFAWPSIRRPVMR